ncbi:MAG TPA: DNA polymerase III subunit delta [Burkholderiales bacterium]|nr:DNA polymerase III subunit delta [Burkholderiales bacterium]
MRLKPEQLQASLARKLSASYLVHGDEPLLALEAADAIRAAARAQGFTQREVLEASRTFDWSEFAHAAGSASLFGDRKLVELRLPTGKPAAPAAQALAAYCGRPNPDVVLLVTMPRPEGAWWKSDWFTALEQLGAVVEVEPLARARLPGWLSQRLAAQKQKASAEALEFLAERVEGNLLAAHQEVQKLALLAPPGELSLDQVQDAVADVARYDVADAVEALVARDTARYVRVVEGLREEGEAPNLLLFVLAAALFVLQGLQRGGSADALFLQHKLFNKRLQPAVQAAARRFHGAALAAALAHAALVDRATKGVDPADPWEELVRLGLRLHQV